MQHYTIQELEESTSVARRTIYYYIREGLLPPPTGRGRGARYTEEHHLRLELVRELRRHTGLGLDGIRALVADADLRTIRRRLERIRTAGDGASRLPMEAARASARQQWMMTWLQMMTEAAPTPPGPAPQDRPVAAEADLEAGDETVDDRWPRSPEPDPGAHAPGPDGPPPDRVMASAPPEPPSPAHPARRSTRARRARAEGPAAPADADGAGRRPRPTPRAHRWLRIPVADGIELSIREDHLETTSATWLADALRRALEGHDGAPAAPNDDEPAARPDPDQPEPRR